MNSGLALLVVAALSAGEPSAPAAPTLGERLQWNARERTAAGRSALEAGDREAAVSDFDTARRLAPDDPRTSYNAGTARIGMDDAAAATLLEEAASAAGDALAPEAWYNLGTARLAAGDARGAVEALTEALRRAPASQDAKHNLELALRRLEQQQKQQQEQQQSGQSQSPQQQGESQPQKSGEPGDREHEGQPQDGSRGQEQASPSSAGDESQPSAGKPGEAGGSGQQAAPPPDALPQFHDLPDMTAEQAAAILRAVEDLERQQRRERAQRAARERARVEIDW